MTDPLLGPLHQAEAHIAAVERWACTVWDDWRAQHAAIAALLA